MNKQCKTCKVIKKASDFTKDRGVCKKCRSIEGQIKYNESKEKEKARLEFEHFQYLAQSERNILNATQKDFVSSILSGEKEALKTIVKDSHTILSSTDERVKSLELLVTSLREDNQKRFESFEQFAASITGNIQSLEESNEDLVLKNLESLKTIQALSLSHDKLEEKVLKQDQLFEQKELEVENLREEIRIIRQERNLEMMKYKEEMSLEMKGYKKEIGLELETIKGEMYTKVKEIVSLELKKIEDQKDHFIKKEYTYCKELEERMFRLESAPRIVPMSDEDFSQRTIQCLRNKGLIR